MRDDAQCCSSKLISNSACGRASTANPPAAPHSDQAVDRTSHRLRHQQPSMSHRRISVNLLSSPSHLEEAYSRVPRKTKAMADTGELSANVLAMKSMLR